MSNAESQAHPRPAKSESPFLRSSSGDSHAQWSVRYTPLGALTSHRDKITRNNQRQQNRVKLV